MGKSFKEEPLHIKIFIIFVIILLIAFIVGFIFAIYYFGILGLFQILNVEYDSLFSFFLFVFFYFLLSFVGDFVAKVFEVLLSFPLKINKRGKILIFFLSHFLITWTIIAFLNMVMSSITIPFTTQIILSLFIALIESTVANRPKKKKEEN